MGRLLFADSRPYRAHEGMVEAEAEMVFDAREILPQISVPVLLIGGDKDIYAPKEVYEETARLIPDCTLRLYEGQGITAVGDKRFPRDVLDFVGRRSRDQPGRGAERPTASDEPARRRIHQDIWIAAPVEEVFALYCDATRWRELAGADMGEITSVSGPIVQVGTTFEGTMRIAGRKITGTGRIAEVEPLRLVRVQATGPGAMGFVARARRTASLRPRAKGRGAHSGVGGRPPPRRRRERLWYSPPVPFDIMGIRIPTLQQDNVAIRCRGCSGVIEGTPFRVNVMDVVATEVARTWAGSSTINPGPYQFHADPACARAWMRSRGYLFCRRSAVRELMRPIVIPGDEQRLGLCDGLHRDDHELVPA